MNLLLLRHGDALSVGYPDEKRPLSTLGEEQALLAARTLRKIGAVPGLIISSPYVRAVKTAELVGEDLSVGNLQISEHLLPGGDSRGISSHLKSLAAERILLVGHEPHLRILLAYLIGAPGTTGIALMKGALASIEIPPDMDGAKGSLRWLLTPDEMAGLH